MKTSLTFEERFWEKVDKQSDDVCWEWLAYVHPTGYGMIARGDGSRKMISSNRASWKIHFGEIPANLCVCHHCDNRKCVNPKHLFLGTYLDNAIDRDMKHRNKIPDNSGENHGKSKLKEKDVLLIRDYLKRENSRSRMKELSKAFGVSITTIYNVRDYKSWKYL